MIRNRKRRRKWPVEVEIREKNWVKIKDKIYEKRIHGEHFNEINLFIKPILFCEKKINRNSITTLHPPPNTFFLSLASIIQIGGPLARIYDITKQSTAGIK